MPQILCKSLAEFRCPQTTESNEICFFRGLEPPPGSIAVQAYAKNVPPAHFLNAAASEKTLLSLQACELVPKQSPKKRLCLGTDEVRRGRLHPFEKMLAGLREPVDFVDRLKRPLMLGIRGRFAF